MSTNVTYNNNNVTNLSLQTDLKDLEGRYVPGDGAHDTVSNIQSRTPLTGFFQQLHKGLTHKHCLHSHIYTHTHEHICSIDAALQTRVM